MGNSHCLVETSKGRTNETNKYHMRSTHSLNKMQIPLSVSYDLHRKSVGSHGYGSMSLDRWFSMEFSELILPLKNTRTFKDKT